MNKQEMLKLIGDKCCLKPNEYLELMALLKPSEKFEAPYILRDDEYDNLDDKIEHIKRKYFPEPIKGNN